VRTVTDGGMTIGRFGRRTGLTPKALRHYDATGVLHPAAVDPDTGYRSYAPEQVAAGRLIRRLRDLDVPLDVVREVLKAQAAGDDVFARSSLGAHLRTVDAALFRYQRIAHRLRMMLEAEEVFEMQMNEMVEVEERRQLAKDLFNETWSLLETPDRTPAQELRMLHMAHASRFHWGEVGTAENVCVGEWQVARVYTVLGRVEPALFHAERCMDVCRAERFDDWKLAYAHEALARAHRLAGDEAAYREHLARAEAILATITDPEERELLEGDLATLRP
jgi:DNA-binding transcriptional MerR regulator